MTRTAADSSTSPLSQLADADLLRTSAFIGNRWLPGGNARFHVIDPATGKSLAAVTNADVADAATAIAAANASLREWSRRPALERARMLQRWYRLMLDHADDLARIMTAEQGKPLAEARAEVLYAASFAEWFAEEGRRTYGETIPTTDRDKRYLVIKQPVGVCAAITPRNFPLAMITRKAAPALAAGCTVVVKPAEQTPLSALALAELALRAGLPAGVFNILPADSDNSIAIGKLLCESPTVRHLSFTGSTEVGRILMRQCAGTLKKLSLELGGNAPFIVFDDADLDAAVAGAVASKFRNAGQTCVCSNRFLVQDGIHDRFVAAFAERAKLIRVGNGFDPDVQQGPLIDDDAVAKVELQIADALAKGARIVCGGQSIGERLLQPTLLADVAPNMLCAVQETFGPLAPVMRFKTEQEAITLANDSESGLASYLYTRDLSRAIRVSEELEYGMVGLNTGAISAAEVPFGGVKQSGMGREGSHHGIDDYLELKYLCIGGVQA
ncbi:NAD-dependent succinate-semialdehyde dehydrogenase [soil metagenome]